MICTSTGDMRWLHTVAFIALLMASTPQTVLLAQGLEDPEAVDTIIGSDIDVAESDTRAEADAVVAALDKTSDSIAEVRKKFTLDKVEIVFLPDIDDVESPIGRKVEEHREEIAELHEAIEGNPMFYHAADSHSLMVRDIVALEFDDANGVKIFAAGKAPAD